MNPEHGSGAEAAGWWSRRGRVRISLVLLAAAGVAVVGLAVRARNRFPTSEGQAVRPAAEVRAEAPRARLQVHATDGRIVRIQLDRPGAPAEEIQAACREVAAGPVTVTVVRRTPPGDLLSESVTLALVPGRLNLVSVGDAPVRANCRRESGTIETLNASWLPPGPVSLHAAEPRLEPGTAGADPGALDFSGEAPASAFDVGAGDGVLVIVNPFSNGVEVRVECSGFTQEVALSGPEARFVPVPRNTVIRFTSRLMPGGELIERRVLEPRDGLPVYSIGGCTRYAWIGELPGVFIDAPSGAISWLPEDVRVSPGPRPRSQRSILACASGARAASLAILTTSVPRVRGPHAPITVSPGAEVRELRLPAEVQDLGVASFATDGAGLVLVAGGRCRDGISGLDLCGPGEQDVARVAAGPAGLVLLTCSGTLASIRAGALVTGPSLNDPGLRMVQGPGTPAAIWCWGESLPRPRAILRVALDGSGVLENTVELAVTAIAPTRDPSAAVVAFGRQIHHVALAGEMLSTSPVLSLPQDHASIVGIADLGDALALSTETQVAVFRGDLVITVAAGIGGEIQPWRGGLLVLDTRSSRLFHVTGPLLASRAGEPHAPRDVPPGEEPVIVHPDEREHNEEQHR